MPGYLELAKISIIGKLVKVFVIFAADFLTNNSTMKR